MGKLRFFRRSQRGEFRGAIVEVVGLVVHIYVYLRLGAQSLSSRINNEVIPEHSFQPYNYSPKISERCWYDKDQHQ